MFLEQSFGSKSKIKILRVLAEVRTAYNLKSLREETALSTGILSMSLRELVEEEVIIRLKGKRKERLYKFNTNNFYASAILELFKQEKTIQRKGVVMVNVWNVLEQVLSQLRKEVSLILLFGSHARGEATITSDIDLLIIPKEKINFQNQKDKIEDIDKRITPLILNLETLKAHVKNETPLIQNIKKDGILLFKSEDMSKDEELINKLIPIYTKLKV
ncbi:nucleotidyltransferase domain-containing protein [archaeon]|nr:nucleotidyltransferase domain-containing protein [archaeon]